MLQARCIGGDDLFAHKKEFGSLEPWVGQPVSFIVESTEKGDAAKKYVDIRLALGVSLPPVLLHIMLIAGQ